MLRISAKKKSIYMLLFLSLNLCTQRAAANGLIKRFCMASIEAQMALAANKPPKGMKDYTCQCFVDEIKMGTSMSSAKSLCREKSIDKFELKSHKLGSGFIYT